MILLDISSWWQNLADFDKIFWGIALLFSLLFLLQTILSFAGGDGDSSFGDADASIDGDHGIGYGFFTIKNMVAFFTIFGWTGLALIKGNASKGVTIAVALAAGVAIVLMMLFLFRSMSKLKQSGTLLIGNAVGKTAEVYLFIPAKREGFGKVHIQLQGSLRELNAITDDEEAIATGRIIKVTAIVNNNTLIVTSTIS
jgi:hypothetical protein